VADNTVLNTGTGGDTVGSDDIAGIKFQRVKLIHGADGVNDGDVAATNPFPVELTDGANTLTIRGTGEAEVLLTNTSATGSITANGQSVTMALEGTMSSIIQVLGTWVGTLEFQLSPDGGTTYYRHECLNPNAASELVFSTTTANGIFQPTSPGGFTHVRITSTAWTSGTANIVMAGSMGVNSFPVFARETNSLLPTYGVQIGGSDGTNLQFLRASNSAPAGTEYALITRSIPSGDDTVVGKAAHDAAVAGNPVRMAGKANANEPTAVADGDTCDAWVDLQGRRVVILNFPANVAADSTTGPKVTTLTTTSDVALVAAPGASLSVYVTGVSASNGSATLTRVDLKDGTTIRQSMYLAASGGGFVASFNPPWKITANTAFNGALSVGVTDVRATVHYFVGP